MSLETVPGELSALIARRNETHLGCTLFALQIQNIHHSAAFDFQAFDFLCFSSHFGVCLIVWFALLLAGGMSERDVQIAEVCLPFSRFSFSLPCLPLTTFHNSLCVRCVFLTLPHCGNVIRPLSSGLPMQTLCRLCSGRSFSFCGTRSCGRAWLLNLQTLNAR